MSVRTILLATAAMMAAVPAWAAEAAAGAAAESNAIETIVVTARKQSEDVLKTPLAVSVLSSKEIAARGIISINDLALNTPGVNVNNSSSGRADRSFQSIIIRGMTPATVNIPIVGMFIDGVPVASPSALESIQDPDHVEVLKGPQSAYFGRATFAGAINVVSKEPANHLSGSASGLIGSRNTYDGQATLEGPIVADKLSFRASFRMFGHDGSWQNHAAAGQLLGDQSTISGSLQLVAHPIEHLTIKFMGMMLHDKDGESAQGIISAYPLTGTNGSTILVNQSNCTLNGQSTNLSGPITVHPNPFICGTLPNLPSNQPANNTVTDAYIKAYLADPTGRIIRPSQGVQGYGLVRTYDHLHLNIDYEIPGTDIVVTSLTGSNQEFFSELSDLDQFDGTTFAYAGNPNRTYFDFPYLVERTNKDVSEELRIRSGQKQRFRWTAGVSYLSNQIRSDGGGTYLNFVPPIPGNTGSSVGGLSDIKTSGVFVGLSYDITSKLTIDLDGRYQVDDISAYNGQLATAVFVPYQKIVEQKFNNFMPRAIAHYAVTPNLMTYVSYSTGVNPGNFNTSYLSLPAAAQADLAAQGFQITVNPEKLDNYEIGAKGKLFGGKVAYSADVYYGNWNNQIVSTSAAPIVLGVPKLVQALLNLGNTKISGFEADFSGVATDHITWNVAGAVNDTDIQKYNSRTSSLLTGITNFKGKELPNTSKYSANVGAQYSDRFSFVRDTDWYVRTDFIYKSGMWTSVANTTRSQDTEIVNMRGGINVGSWNFEAYATNLFDNKAYTAVAENTILTPTFALTAYNSYVNVALPALRTFGARAKYKF